MAMELEQVFDRGFDKVEVHRLPSGGYSAFVKVESVEGMAAGPCPASALSRAENRCAEKASALLGALETVVGASSRENREQKK